MKYPSITISLPAKSDPHQVRSALAAVSAKHGYTTKYHKSFRASPGVFIMAITSGEVVTTPFMDEWYGQAIEALRPFAGEGWADALIAGIKAAQDRRIQAELGELDSDSWGSGTPFEDSTPEEWEAALDPKNYDEGED